MYKRLGQARPTARRRKTPTAGLLNHERKEIDNGATERANRDIAIGRGNWTFFGSDNGGKTAALLLSFIATCKRCRVQPFAWFRDVLSRIANHPVSRLAELLPHNWKPLDAAAAQA